MIYITYKNSLWQLFLFQQIGGTLIFAPSFIWNHSGEICDDANYLTIHVMASTLLISKIFDRNWTFKYKISTFINY